MNAPTHGVSTHGVLAESLWREDRAAAVRPFVLAFAGSLLLAISAKIQVPFWPVPMTMQTYVVLVLGAMLGARLGVTTVLVYLAEGAAGLPVFAGTPEKGIGLAYMVGPTGGYLAGFLIAVAIVGLLAERGWDKSVWKLFLAMAIGHAVIFACGLGWLAQSIGWEKAWLAGAVPFYLATAFKTGLGAVTLPAAWTLVRRD